MRVRSSIAAATVICLALDVDEPHLEAPRREGAHPPSQIVLPNSARVVTMLVPASARAMTTEVMAAMPDATATPVGEGVGHADARRAL